MRQQQQPQSPLQPSQQPEHTNRTVYDTVVIGGGPAGIAAACALQDAGLSVLVLDQHRV